jgi:hypothetical protein
MELSWLAKVESRLAQCERAATPTDSIRRKRQNITDKRKKPLPKNFQILKSSGFIGFNRLCTIEI